LRITDAQVRKLREDVAMGRTIGQAALRAGMHRNTGGKYAGSEALPSEAQPPRTWRTRDNPFEGDWPGIVALLEDAPEFETKTIFDDLVRRRPGCYQEGQLRTLQRHVRRWRARHGPPKDVFFPQVHRPGEAAQTDFTWTTELAVTIAGEPYPHLLCHVALPYSNWSFATPCASESIPALKEGIQTALFRLGRVPRYHQTDNSSAATHGLSTGRRAFNDEYRQLVEHLGMEPRTIAVGESHQNGDVEALNGALKRGLVQHLLLRGSRDFASRAAYVAWLEEALERRNALRSERLQEELAVMAQLPARRLPAYTVVRTRVGPGSTVRAKDATYSVPSRLVGEHVCVHVYDDRLEVHHGDVRELTVARERGKGAHRVQYRHVVEALARKPGAFRRYRYFEALFPTEVFRRAFEALDAAHSRWKADVAYLRILRLAARTMESDVEAALREVLDAGGVPDFAAVEARVAPRAPAVPEVHVPAVDLAGYDDLLAGGAGEVAA
jgi:transposase InsO family protein